MRYECSYCTNTYARKDGLNRHIKNKHTAKTEQTLKKFVCTYCDKTWEHKFDLNRHIKKVHKKKFACKIPQYLLANGYKDCNCNYSLLSQLLYHICVVHKDLIDTAHIRSIVFESLLHNKNRIEELCNVQTLTASNEKHVENLDIITIGSNNSTNSISSDTSLVGNCCNEYQTNSCICDTNKVSFNCGVNATPQSAIRLNKHDISTINSDIAAENIKQLNERLDKEFISTYVCNLNSIEVANENNKANSLSAIGRIITNEYDIDAKLNNNYNASENNHEFIARTNEEIHCVLSAQKPTSVSYDSISNTLNSNNSTNNIIDSAYNDITCMMNNNNDGTTMDISIEHNATVIKLDDASNKLPIYERYNNLCTNDYDDIGENLNSSNFQPNTDRDNFIFNESNIADQLYQSNHTLNIAKNKNNQNIDKTTLNQFSTMTIKYCRDAYNNAHQNKIVNLKELQEKYTDYIKNNIFTKTGSVCFFPKCNNIYFNNRASWYSHITKHWSTSFKCLVCTKKFSTHDDYINHLETAKHGKSKQKKYQNNNLTITNQLAEDNFDLLYICHICQKTYLSRQGYEAHIQTHNK